MAKRRHVNVLPSAARTATPTAVEVDVPPDAVAALVLIDVTAINLTPTITPTISGVVPTSGNLYTILTGAGLTATGVTALELGPGMDDTANVVESAILPLKLSVAVAHTDTDSITYSVDIVFI